MKELFYLVLETVSNIDLHISDVELEDLSDEEFNEVIKKFGCNVTEYNGQELLNSLNFAETKMKNLVKEIDERMKSNKSKE